MAIQGLDSYGALPVALLEPYAFIGRYIAQQPGKVLVPSEVAEYHAAGKSIIAVYEDDANDAAGGAAVGAEKAKIALPILDSIGWPADLPVHFAVDGPGYSWLLPTFLACCEAFAEGIDRPVAVYGDVDTCTYAYQHDVRYLWQFGEGRCPGITVWQSPATQLDGYNIDPDEALVADYGQWAPNPPKPPAPTPEVLPVEFIAEGPASAASFLYDTQSKTRRGISEAATVAALEAVGIKNYKATLDKTFLALFADTPPNFD